MIALCKHSGARGVSTLRQLRGLLRIVSIRNVILGIKLLRAHARGRGTGGLQRVPAGC